MNYALTEAKNEIRSRLAEIGPELADLALEHPPKEIDADLAMPVFPLARVWRKGPPVIAKEIAERLAWPESSPIASCEAAGGYVNFRFRTRRFAERVASDVAERGRLYGQSNTGAGQSVLVDYSSPNIGKPMSVGHLRSTIIGESLCRIYERIGYRVVGLNFLGDWGTQYGKLIYAWTQWGDEAALAKDPIQELLRIYVKFHDEVEENEALEPVGREWFARLEQGDEEALAIWRRFREMSLKEFEAVYARLGVRFDVWGGESEFYGESADRIIHEAEEKGLARKEGDALIMPLDEHGISVPILLRKSNGTTSYESRDLAAAVHRLETYGSNLLIYCVGNDQTFHFRQVFTGLEMLGYAANARFVHVSFGMMTLPEGRMSTRKGRVVLLEEVIDEAIERAGRIIEEKNPDLTPEERAEVARVIGIGAIKYSDLSQTRVKDITFDWDRMLAFDGDSAPYLQYTYVRCRSIRRRANAEALPFSGDALEASEERNLLRTLARFPEVVAVAAEEFAPHMIANYLFNLAQEFQGFYEKVPVLKADTPQQVANRLALVDSVATALQSGLSLLGIECPERM